MAAIAEVARLRVVQKVCVVLGIWKTKLQGLFGGGGGSALM